MLALSDLIVMNLIVRTRQVHPWHYHRFGLRRFVCHLKSIYKQHLGIIRSGEEGGVTYYSCIKHRKFMAKILKLTIGIALRRITVKHPIPHFRSSSQMISCGVGLDLIRFSGGGGQGLPGLLWRSQPRPRSMAPVRVQHSL